VKFGLFGFSPINPPKGVRHAKPKILKAGWVLMPKFQKNSKKI
jgi:hypothetical protein